MSNEKDPQYLVPYGLRVETGGDSFAVSSGLPEISWQLPLQTVSQEGYEIEALVNGEPLHHRARGAGHLFVVWPWAPLQSSQSVQWRVRLLGERTTEWSEWSHFESGLFEGDWTAQWISSPEGSELSVGSRPAYLFSTTFELDQVASSARLYSTALGVYDVTVNGKRVGNSELAPGSESYDRTLYAQAHDIVALLQAGTNTIEIRLSDGWYRGRANAFRHQAAWGAETAIRAEIHLFTLHQRYVAVATDTTWSVSEAEIVKADLMDGQTTDLRRAPKRVGLAIPAAETAPPVTWSPAPPVRVIQQIKPTNITRLSDDVVVVDFGQNASGWVRLTSLGVAGDRTTLDFGEHVVPSGDVTLSHLDTPSGNGVVSFVQHDEVVSDGNPDSFFEPRHTVHGFRYVRVERPGLVLTPADITMQVVHTDLRTVGSFECSDPDLVRLYEVSDWSFRGNAVDVPTDCPTRERAGWTGDWQIFLPTATRLYDVDGFTRKWLKSVRDDQLDDGRIANMSPDNARLRVVPDPMSDMATGSAGWGDAIVLVPWELYRTYGDRMVLGDCWEAMVRWIDFALKSAAEKRHPSRVERSAEPLPHESYIWDGTFHFGEWCEPTPLNEDGSPGPTMPDPMAWAMADKGEVGTAYLYRSLHTMAEVAKVIGRDQDSSHYATLARKVRRAWQREFLDKSARTTAGTQASYVRALAFDLVPEDHRSRATAHLVELIEAAGNHLTTGFLSTADLLPVLADNGQTKAAHRLLLQRSTPSWLGMLDRGATTIWEEWEGIDRNGNASASLNHYSKGAVVKFLQTHTLGLRQAPDSVAWESFLVAPVVPEHLTWAKGHYDSPQGRIRVDWALSKEDAVLRVSVPGGATGIVFWGEETHNVGPGNHTFAAPRETVVETTLTRGQHAVGV